MAGYEDFRPYSSLDVICPKCGKTINAKAIRCKYCKTMLKKY